MYGARMNGGDVAFLDALIEGGAGGKKQKKGVFDYSDKKKKGVVSDVFKQVQSKVNFRLEKDVFRIVLRLILISKNFSI